MNSLGCKIKKTILLILCLTFLSSFFCGCFNSNKIDEEKQKLIQQSINEYMYQLSVSVISENKKNRNLKAYKPASLQKLLKISIYKDGKKLYLSETYFPQYKGSFELLVNYHEDFDSGDWLESLLLHLEEERIADAIDEMVENFSIEAVDENLEEEITRQLNNEITEVDYINKSSELALLEYDDEVFIPQKTAEGYVTVHGIKKNITRRFYDEQFLLQTKELWTIPSLDGAVLNQSESYSYFDDINKVKEKIVTVADEKKVIDYLQNGNIASVSTYKIVEEKNCLVSSVIYTYNADNSLYKMSETDYSWNKNYTKKTDSFEKLFVYAYNQDDIPADFDYFENGILKMKNKYSSEKGTYTSQVFFENDYSVKTYYEKNIRVKEVYTVSGKVRRTKVYE